MLFALNWNWLSIKGDSQNRRRRKMSKYNRLKGETK